VLADRNEKALTATVGFADQACSRPCVEPARRNRFRSRYGGRQRFPTACFGSLLFRSGTGCPWLR
jgi:hypothetical protein